MKKIFFLLTAYYFVLSGCVSSLQTVKNNKILIWSELQDKPFNKNDAQLSVFSPADSINNGSAVIICPGGSYAYLGIKNEGSAVASWLNSLGFTAFVLRYRVAWQGYHYPASIQDLQRSIQIIRENATKWKINPHLVGVVGFSAGGHLAGTAAIHYNENFMKPLGIETNVSLRPDFIVMNYPVVSMHDSIAHKKSKRYLLDKHINSKELENKLSLEDNIHAGMPPVFLMQTKYDKVVNAKNAHYFHQSLIKNNIPVKYVVFDKTGHGFGANPKKNMLATAWMKACEEWFAFLGIKLKLMNKYNNAMLFQK